MKLANTLTNLSNNYLDWSRTGDLFFSGVHRYNISQIAQRAAVIITIATSAYLGAALNDPEETKHSDMAMTIAGGMFGLVLSHVFVVAPLVHKRYVQNQACKKLVDDIYHSIQDNPESISLEIVKDVIEVILNSNLQNDKHSNASRTWGLRKDLLSTFNTLLTNKDTALFSALKTGTKDDVLTILKNESSHQEEERSDSMTP